MKSIKSILAAAAVLIMACSTPASAEVCKIEEFVCRESPRGMFILEGTSTCYRGSMLLRLYKNARYIGNAESIVSNYAFNVPVGIRKENRKSLNIKYSITSIHSSGRPHIFKIHPPCWK